MHRIVITGAALAGLFILAVLTASAAGQPPESLVVDADQIIFDQLTQIIQAEGNVRLRYRGIRLTADRVQFNVAQEQLEAEGRVALVDAGGRELRGRRLRYDVRLQVAEIEQAQAIVERVYVRSARLHAEPRRVEAQDALIAACNPANPAYRITAAHVEIVPGDRLVARQASLWVGRLRVLTLPVLTLSLRTGEETSRSLPRLGYNTVDSVWVAYPYGYRLGAVDGTLHTKYGVQTGFIIHNTLTFTPSPYAMSLTIGRNQNELFQLYDQAEAVVEASYPTLGRIPVSYGFAIRSGWFREPGRPVETSRTQYELRLQSSTVALSPRTMLTASARVKDAHYGTGTRYGVVDANLSVAHQLAAGSTLNLQYRVFESSGVTPFVFDAIRPEDLINRVDVWFARSGARAGQIATTYVTGVFYDFRGRSPGVSASYGERRDGAYHWGLGAEYHFTTNVIKLVTDSGRAFGPGTYATIQAGYFPQTGQFADLDLFVTARLCDCFNLTLKYRHVRREFWLEIAAVPDPRMEFPAEPTEPSQP